ncbi:30S ribosomal S1 isoform X1 [Olea europaea subsp. europaea]|uniref:30S ribosomal S1 isoform X1 n=1 Tax=Olea europaea subsp. europaea TaxID=158383 RepID=A0A8S0VGP2_OLEEU|nr:30S ribosomal S1 isoform X1 [Olea europaea subsp. europaea]
MPVSAASVGSISAFLSHFFGTESATVTNSQPSLSLTRSSSARRQPGLGAPKVSVSSDSNTKTDGVVDQSSLSPDETKQARRYADWKAARVYNEKGLIYGGRIEGFNGGGLLIRFYSLLGFLPFPLSSPSHSCKEPHKTVQEIARDLTGSIPSVKVIQADEGNRKLRFSEREAEWSKFLDYGAFIHLLFPDGLVHVSEVSWDLIRDVRDILTEGDEVRVKIINIDREKSRITLSIKQLEEDPLLETLDKVIPQDVSTNPDSLNASDHFTIEPLPGLDIIMNELLQEDGYGLI